MNRRTFIQTSAGILSTGALLPAAGLASQGRSRRAAPGRPNVVLIVADDLGYAELGVQGCQDIPTPNIDSIARNGVRFTDGYVSCPVCSPTRAGLTTGRYQQRFGHEFNPGPATAADAEFGLPLSETTLADRMKSLGYATGMVGKWHLGYKPELHPLKRGFEEFFGFLGGAHSYVNAMADKANLILRGAEPVDEKEYLTDAFAREAVAFINRRQKEPFFLYLTFNATHGPMEPVEKYTSGFPSIQDQRRRTFAGMLSALDEGVGAVLKTLRESGLEDNTLLFFVSDNGGPTAGNTARNDPFRGFKGQVLEGGIRVPFLMQWKARVPAGVVYRRPVIALDLLPTAVAAGGGTLPANAAVDGVDLVPYLTGKDQSAPHEALYWRFGQQAAIRKADWKLLRQAEEPWQLYNLAQDAGEKNDVASANPGKVKELQAAYEAWNQQLAPPRWGRADRGAKKLGGARKARKAGRS